MRKSTEKHHSNLRYPLWLLDNDDNGRVGDCGGRGNSDHQTMNNDAGCPDNNHRKSYVNDISSSRYGFLTDNLSQLQSQCVGIFYAKSGLDFQTRGK